MASSKIKFILFGLLAAFLFAISASALEESPELHTSAAAEEDAPAAEDDAPAAEDESDYAIDPEIAQMSNEEKVESGKTKINEMRGVLKNILKLFREAGENQDLIRLDCVNKKLTIVKGLLRISEQANILLQEAFAKSNGKAATHELQKIIIAHSKVMPLLAEAESCSSEEDVLIGEGTEVVVMGPEGGVETPDITGVQPDAVNSGGTSSPGAAGDNIDSPSPDGTSTPDIEAQTNPPPLPIPPSSKQ